MRDVRMKKVDDWMDRDGIKIERRVGKIVLHMTVAVLNDYLKGTADDVLKFRLMVTSSSSRGLTIT